MADQKVSALATVSSIATTDLVYMGVDPGGSPLSRGITVANFVLSIDSVLDHGNISGLSDDDHTQYALLAGRSGGQSWDGGTASDDDLTIDSTSHATKGDIYLNPTGGMVSVGNSAPLARLHVESGAVAVTPNSGADELLLEQTAAACGMTIASDNNQNGNVAFGDPDNAIAGLIQYKHATDDMTLTTEAGAGITIDSTGQLGIGTDPLATLHVQTANLTVTPDADADELILENTANTGMSMFASTTGTSQIQIKDTSGVKGSLVFNHTSDYWQLGTQGGVPIFVDVAGLLVGSTFSATQAKVHIFDEANAQTPAAGANELFIEGSTGDVGLTIMTDDSSICNIYFSDTTTNNVGRITYDHSSDIMSLWVNSVQKVFVQNDGIGIGVSPDSTSGTNLLILADNTVAPTSLPANSAGLFADDVAGTTELFAVDEDGNTMQLSPHGFLLFTPDTDGDHPTQKMPFSHLSRHPDRGMLQVDWGMLIREIERLSGAKLAYWMPPDANP